MPISKMQPVASMFSSIKNLQNTSKMCILAKKHRAKINKNKLRHPKNCERNGKVRRCKNSPLHSNESVISIRTSHFK